MAARILSLAFAVCLAGGTLSGAQSLDGSGLREALETALRPAMPFPPARVDGTPETGGAQPVWTVQWAPGGEPRVQVLANPLNDENRQRALEAEKAIQKAAMAAQRRSQSDYEKALSDFSRTGRTSEIREISLHDEGVAGERYDAESQLTVTAEVLEDSRTFSIATAVAPRLATGIAGTAAVVRVAANTYVAGGADGLAGTARYCPEQAWVLIGSVTAAVTPGTDAPAFDVSVSLTGDGRGRHGVMVWIRGNAELVEQVLARGDWEVIGARAGG